MYNMELKGNRPFITSKISVGDIINDMCLALLLVYLIYNTHTSHIYL